MIEVFKTNVEKSEEAKSIVTILLKHFPKHKINFDLDDCDKILRIEGEDISYREIIDLLQKNNFQCRVLE